MSSETLWGTQVPIDRTRVSFEDPKPIDVMAQGWELVVTILQKINARLDTLEHRVDVLTDRVLTFDGQVLSQRVTNDRFDVELRDIRDQIIDGDTARNSIHNEVLILANTQAVDRETLVVLQEQLDEAWEEIREKEA